MVKDTLNVKEPVGASIENFGEASFQVILSYHFPYPMKDPSEAAVKQEINMKAYSILLRYTSEKAIAEIKHTDEK